MMANIHDLESLLLGNSNFSDETDLGDIMKFTNGSAYLSNDPLQLGDSHSMPWEQIVLLVAYGLLISISLFGNTLVCHVILKNPRMQTVTNFFIANLAVADLLLTCINVPFNIARNLLDDWPFGSVICHLLNFSLMVSVYVSTFTLLGIALDRQQVLLYPLSPRMSRPVGVLVLCLIWFLAIGLSLPYGLYNNVRSVDFVLKEVKRCVSDYPQPSDQWEKYLTIVTLILQYVIPLAIIGVTYGRIVRKLWIRTHVGAVTENQQASQQRTKRKSIKMLIFVVIVFALCWMPLNLYQVLADFHPNVEVFHYNSTTFFICHWIAISSTCYNPFVYCWLNESFRAEVKSRFKCFLPRPKRVHPGVDINGILMRSDRAYRRRQSSKSSTSINRTSISTKACDKYRVEIDAITREQAELMAEIAESTNGDLSSNGAVGNGISSVLETVSELPELTFAENSEAMENSSSEANNYNVQL
ncbi:neuropeptide Y receptor [Mactra antiquata]